MDGFVLRRRYKKQTLYTTTLGTTAAFVTIVEGPAPCLLEWDYSYQAIGHEQNIHKYIYIYIYLFISAPWGAPAPQGAKHDIQYRPKANYVLTIPAFRSHQNIGPLSRLRLLQKAAAVPSSNQQVWRDAVRTFTAAVV